MCAARGIYTVEQLAKISGDNTPPQIRELAERARKMVALQKDSGRFEAKIRDLEQQREALAGRTQRVQGDHFRAAGDDRPAEVKKAA